MPRIRTIKPEFPQSESMGRIGRESRLLFVLLWTLADDSGRLRGHSRVLASLLYPYDTDAGTLIEGWMAELEHEECIRRYMHNGDTYLEVCNWNKHQKIDKPSASKLPPFVESSRIVANPLEHSSEDQGSRTEGSKEGTTEMISSPSAQSDSHESNDVRKEEMEIIERMFLFYCEAVGRDPKRYTLTDERRKKALFRLRERRKIHGNLESAAEEIARAIENVAANEYIMSHGYFDWLEQIFRSAEEFEKRLNWERPLQADTGKGANFESKNARIVRETLNELNHRQAGANG
jgi:hypothetical protein